MADAATFPHRYQVSATAAPEGDVLLATDGLSRPLRTSAPPAFGGPGDRWSPETLLVGAAADCFALTFRAMARVARLPWLSLECEADGVLDRVSRAAQFTAFELRAYLRVPPGTSEADAHRVLERARDWCVISHSLKAPVGFAGHVEVAATTTEAA